MGSIVTFYSYKGGVGRTMALANIAALLVKRGKKVLVVDWDLEAPGLERYFADYIDLNKYLELERGLLDLLVDAWASDGSKHRPDWRQYLQRVALPVGELALLTSGKNNEHYAARLERFDWAGFFEQWRGGDFFERLREDWLKEFDFTLIDSRTGLSDSGGVCTILMPDVLVAMFTANHQSLYGIRDVIDLAQKSRQNLVHDRMPLQVLPIPSRWDGRGNVDEARQWLKQIAEVTEDFFCGWLPRDYTALQMVERLKIPQVGQFSFGEKLPALTHSTTDADLPGFAYEAATFLLANDFANADKLLGVPIDSPEAELFAKRIPPAPKDVEYLYDVYVSYRKDPLIQDWTTNIFLPALREELDLWKDRRPTFFVDTYELGVGAGWPDRAKQAALRSRVLLALLTPSYFKSLWCLAEWMTFAEREQFTGVRPLIIPIAMSGRANYPADINKRQSYDMSKFLSHSDMLKRTPRYLDFRRIMRPLARSLSEVLDKVPPYDSDWSVAVAGESYLPLDG